MNENDLFIHYPFSEDVSAIFSKKGLDFRLDKRKNPCFEKSFDALGDFLLKRFFFDIKKEGVLFPEQVHGNLIIKVAPHGIKASICVIPKSDGLVTTAKRIAIAMLSADCLPIFLYDPKDKAIGIMHAGWKGTQMGIAQRAIQIMAKEFHTDTNSLKVLLGPCIRSCCYNIEKERADLFKGYYVKRHDSYFLDMVSLNMDQLKNQGVLEENIIDCGICTSCNSMDFFSYRRHGKECGRTISLILKK